MCCYLASKNIEANYLAIKNGTYTTTTIGIAKVLGISPESTDIYFAFEAQYTPFQKYVIGTLPRTDIVIQKEHTGECISGLEVKLTALPDNTTCAFNDNLYGSEIVVRPDTIVYLACSLILSAGRKLYQYFENIGISDWTDAKLVLPKIKHINRYMSCKRLEAPILSKGEIKNIILGGGQDLLSPERRFDAIIFNSPELFQ